MEQAKAVKFLQNVFNSYENKVLNKVDLDTLKKLKECTDNFKDKVNDLCKKIEDEEKNNSEPICGVCFEPSRVSTIVQFCGHTFCYKCNTAHLSNEILDNNLRCHKCPQCSDPINKPNGVVCIEGKTTVGECKRLNKICKEEYLKSTSKKRKRALDHSETMTRYSNRRSADSALRRISMLVDDNRV